jgi:hypothetical protein
MHNDGELRRIALQSEEEENKIEKINRNRRNLHLLNGKIIDFFLLQ